MLRRARAFKVYGYERVVAQHYGGGTGCNGQIAIDGSLKKVDRMAVESVRSRVLLGSSIR
jgi:hypothetical protein